MSKFYFHSLVPVCVSVHLVFLDKALLTDSVVTV